MEPVRLAEPVGPGAAEAGRRREDEGRAAGPLQHLEGTPFDGGALVDMAAEHELGTRGGEAVEGDVPVLERELARGAPRGTREVVMADDDPQRPGRRVAEHGRRELESASVEAAALVAPGADGVEPADDGAGGPQGRVGRPDHSLEPLPRSREPRRECVRDVVIAGHRENGNRETVEERPGLLELTDPPAVRQIAAGDDELGLELPTELDERIVERRCLTGAAMEVGDVDCAGGHRRTRLYTRSMSEQSPEIFDDLYLGLQAGGALRKQRRGEELTEQEEAALGHWQRLSVWRKALAVGAFAIGTFGLGFTLGGLVFGRRRATR